MGNERRPIVEIGLHGWDILVIDGRFGLFHGDKLKHGPFRTLEEARNAAAANTRCMDR